MGLRNSFNLYSGFQFQNEMVVQEVKGKHFVSMIQEFNGGKLEVQISYLFLDRRLN